MAWEELEKSGIKAYYKDNAVFIINADCREVLPELPKADLVLTSPPFNLGNTHHTGSIKHKCYNDDMPELDYQSSQIEILEQLWRVVKDSGSLCYQHKNRIKAGKMITPYEWLLKTKWLAKQEIVWFNGSQNFDKIRFYPMTERIYWLAKSNKTQLDNSLGLHDDWHIEPVGTDNKFTRAYPEELVNRIIVSFPQAELILDPFLGSGTTCYCAKKLLRKSIGIEIEEKYCEIAANRCRQMVFDLTA